MLDSQTMSNLLDLKEIWPRLTDNFKSIEERVDPVMPLLVDVFKGASFTVWEETGQKIVYKLVYKLLDENDALVTNETMKISAKVSNHVFFRRLFWNEVVIPLRKNPSYRRGDLLEKIIQQVES